MAPEIGIGIGPVFDRGDGDSTPPETTTQPLTGEWTLADNYDGTMRVVVTRANVVDVRWTTHDTGYDAVADFGAGVEPTVALGAGEFDLSSTGGNTYHEFGPGLTPLIRVYFREAGKLWSTWSSTRKQITLAAPLAASGVDIVTALEPVYTDQQETLDLSTLFTGGVAPITYTANIGTTSGTGGKDWAWTPAADGDYDLTFTATDANGAIVPRNATVSSELDPSYNPGVLITGTGAWFDGEDESTMFDVDGGTAVNSDGQVVGEWQPSVGTATYDAINTGTARPVWRAPDAVEFDGVNDYLDTGITAGLYATGVQAWTVIVACDIQPATQAILAKCSATAGSRQFYLYMDGGDGNLKVFLRGVNTALGAKPAGRFRVTIRWNGATSTAEGKINDGAWVTLNVGAAANESTQSIMLGARTTASPAFFMQGEIGQVVIVTDTAVSDADLVNAHNYIDAHYINAASTVTPVNTVSPSASGSGVVGVNITGDVGTWTGADTYAWAWQKNGVDTATTGTGTTVTAYDTSADLASDVIRLRVTATSVDSIMATAYSNEITLTAGGTVTATANPMTLTVSSGPEVISVPTVTAPADPSNPLIFDQGEVEILAGGTYDWSFDRESVAASGTYDVNLASDVGILPTVAPSGYIVQQSDQGFGAKLTVTWTDERGTTQVLSTEFALTTSPQPYLALGYLPVIAIEQSVGQADIDMSEYVVSGTPETYALVDGDDPVPAGVSISSAGVLSSSGTAAALGSKNVILRVTNSNGPEDFALILKVQNTAVVSNSLTVRGVTFNFSGNVTHGTYWNGEPWVLAHPSVTLTGTSEPGRVAQEATEPQYFVGPITGSRIINGMQVDWADQQSVQGMDDTAGAHPNTSRDEPYTDSYNKDPNYTGTPLSLSTPKTFIKGVSALGSTMEPSNYWYALRLLILVTVVQEIPRENSFRPSGEPGNKRSRYAQDDLRFDLLLKNAKPTTLGNPDWDGLAQMAKWPRWLNSGRTDQIRVTCARENQFDYGRGEARYQSTAALALCLNVADSVKMDLASGLVQQGLDLYDSIVVGGRYQKATAGNGMGRKFPNVLAAHMLNNPDISCSSLANPTLEDDGMYFYVTSTDVARPLEWLVRDEGYPFTDGMIGVPDWGVLHWAPNGNGAYLQPEQSTANWNRTYRDICSRANGGIMIMGNLTPGMRALFKNEAYMDYHERVMMIEGATGTSTGDHPVAGFDDPSFSDDAWQSNSWWKGQYNPCAEDWGLTFYAPQPEIPGNYITASTAVSPKTGESEPLKQWKAITLNPIAGGFEAVYVPNGSQIAYPVDYETVVEIDLRYRLQGSPTWTQVNNVPATHQVTGLGSGNVYEVQHRVRHPTNGASDWAYFVEWWDPNDWDAPGHTNRTITQSEVQDALLPTVTTG